MVHGLWSSPTTWMEMFNDLRAFPEIREPLPVLVLPLSHRASRSGPAPPNCATRWPRSGRCSIRRCGIRTSIRWCSSGTAWAVSSRKLQTVESGDDFWRILSDKPFEELKADPEDRARLAKAFYFHPNPSVKRVITIGTPHRGSDFANDYTREIGRRLIVLPEMMLELTNKISLQNPGYFRSTDLLTTNTSIDSLAPDCPIFPVLLNAQPGPGTHYHNVIGVVARKTWLGRVSESGDGVVAYESAHLEGIDSELIVEADHLAVHRHPLAVLEVRRILNEHLRTIIGPAMFAAQPVPAGPR